MTSEKENLVLVSLARHGQNALATSIRDDIERREGDHYSAHEIFEELQRLETLGLASSSMSGSRVYFHHITDSDTGPGPIDSFARG
jgi:hypothetical protein